MAENDSDSVNSTLSSVVTSVDNRHYTDRPHHHHHHHGRHSRPQNTYLRHNSPVGLEPLTKWRKPCDHTHSSKGVSIATQVISPSAIGGSLKFGHRRPSLCTSYYPEQESDLVGLFVRKRRIPWGKISCYVASFGIMLAVLTGVVIAVGYMQTEKHRILSEKLQATDNSVPTWRPKVPVVTRTTKIPVTITSSHERTTEETTDAKNLPGLIGATESLSDAENGEIDTVKGEITTEVYPPTLDVDFPDVQVTDTTNDAAFTETTASSAVESDEGTTAVTQEMLEESTLPLSEQTASGMTGAPVVQEETPLLHPLTIDNKEEVELHKSPAEVRVTPPKGFSFNGFSLEIPIYKGGDQSRENYSFLYPTQSPKAPVNITLHSLSEHADPLPQLNPSGNSVELGYLEIIPASKLQTDLFSSDEDGTEFEGENFGSEMMSVSSTRRIPKISPADNHYTPRPGTNPVYPDRPKFSSEYNQHNLQDYSSNRSEVRVVPPATSPKPVREELGPAKNDTPDSIYNAIEAPKFEETTASPVNNFQFGTPSTQITVTPAPLQTATTPFHFDFSQLTTPAPHGFTSPPFHIHPVSTPEPLSKRTYNFDFETSAATNPFANILNTQAGGITGVIGSPTSTGATLGVQHQHSYDDFNNYFNFQPLPPLNIPSGTVPIDLASSYIQVGGAKSPSQDQYSSNFGYNPSYSYGNPTFNLGSQGGSASSNFPSITTSVSNPNPPAYNTITQGMHLLSLLSGSIPQHLLDSQVSSSSVNEQVAGKPELQIAALAGYGGSASSFLNSKADSNSPVSRSSDALPHYSADFYTSKSFSPANNQQPSFGQNIVSKLAQFSNPRQAAIPDSLSSASAFVPVKSVAPKEVNENEISNILRLPGLKDTSLVTDSDTSASEARHIITQKDFISLEPGKQTINFAKRKPLSQSKLAAGMVKLNAKGLKSGFYT